MSNFCCGRTLLSDTKSQGNSESNRHFLRPGPPLQSLGMSGSRKWIYTLTLTLEELFYGKLCRFCIVRHLRLGDSDTVMLVINVPPGCREGTEILCRGVGHEVSAGKFQDITLIVKEVSHDRFFRIQDDLFLDVRLKSFGRQSGTISIENIDHEEISIHIDRIDGKMLKGSFSVPGAGMPIRDGGGIHRRGCLVVR